MSIKTFLYYSYFLVFWGFFAFYNRVISACYSDYMFVSVFFFICLSQIVCWYFDIDDEEITAGIDLVDSFVQID